MPKSIKSLEAMPKKFFVLAFIALSILFFLWFFLLKDILADIETVTYDWRAKISTEKSILGASFSKHDRSIILVAADDYSGESLKNYPDLKIGRWPWPRKVMGEVVEFISKGKPKSIVFDIKFQGQEGHSPENISSDKYFADVIKDKNIVLATALTSPRSDKNFKNFLDFFEETLEGSGQSLYQLPGEQIDRSVYEVYKKAGQQVKSLNDRFAVKLKKDYYTQQPFGEKNSREFLDNITFYGKSNILEEFLDNSQYIGVINLKSGDSAVFRHHVPLYRLVHEEGISYLPSLPLAAVLSIIPEYEKSYIHLKKNKLIIGKRQIPVNDRGEILLNWHGEPKTYETISISRIILSSAFERGKIKNVEDFDKIDPEIFKNKIVVIGQTEAGTDINPTPMHSIYPGPEIIATAIDNLLNDTDTTNEDRRKFVQKSPFIADLLITLTLCLILGLIIGKSQSNLIKVQAFIFINILFLVLAIYLFVDPDIRVWINMTYPVLFIFITGISTFAYKMYLESRARKAIEGLFGKFVSPQILDKLLTEEKRVSQSGQRKAMSVLFSDIRGFTTLSENIPAEKVISILNEYLTEMVEVILSFNGTLDKYIGDAIMAFYNDPVEMEDHALRAVLTAMGMKAKLSKLNDIWKEEGRPTLSIGLGVNTGEMIVGHMGSPRLVDYTVIGDNVNLTSRIESLTKNYGVDIIISESTYQEVKDHIECTYLDEVAVKGKQNAVKIYSVNEIKPDSDLVGKILMDSEVDLFF